MAVTHLICWQSSFAPRPLALERRARTRGGRGRPAPDPELDALHTVRLAVAERAAARAALNADLSLTPLFSCGDSDESIQFAFVTCPAPLATGPPCPHRWRARAVRPAPELDALHTRRLAAAKAPRPRRSRQIVDINRVNRGQSTLSLPCSVPVFTVVLRVSSSPRLRASPPLGQPAVRPPVEPR